MESQAVFQAKTQAEMFLLNCHPGRRQAQVADPGRTPPAARDGGGHRRRARGGDPGAGAAEVGSAAGSGRHPEERFREQGRAFLWLAGCLTIFMNSRV